MSESSHNSFRGDMMGKGEDNGMKTVESLRGRLLSEREASKAAKNEADLIAKRQLGELERQLAIEIKYRNRAEKRLQYALKRLQSLKRPNRPENSASSSEGWKVNSGEAANSSEGSVTQGEVEEMMSGGGLKYVARDDGLGTSSGDSANQVVSQEESWSSVGTAHSRSKEGAMPDEEISARDNQELTVCVVRESPRDVEHSDDTLALVPVVNMHSSSNTNRREINSSNVQEVLLALAHVKEQLRNSMGRRSTVISSHRELCGQILHPENPILS